MLLWNKVIKKSRWQEINVVPLFSISSILSVSVCQFSTHQADINPVLQTAWKAIQERLVQMLDICKSKVTYSRIPVQSAAYLKAGQGSHRGHWAWILLISPYNLPMGWKSQLLFPPRNVCPYNSTCNSRAIITFIPSVHESMTKCVQWKQSLDLGARWRWKVVTFRPIYFRERTPVRIEEAGWVLEKVWTCLNVRKSLVLELEFELQLVQGVTQTL